MLRKLINKYIIENVMTKEVGLLFSGGMDSLSILLSLLDCNIKPTLYAFYVDGVVSDDIVVSRKIANLLNLNLIETEISRNINDLEADVRYIIKEFDVKKKTQVQCIHPFTHMVKSIKEDVVLSGLCADDLYGTARKMAEIKNNTKLFNEKRLEKLNNAHSSSYYEIKKIFTDRDKRLLCPYKDGYEIIEYFLALTYDQMHMFKQKGIMYLDYKDFIDENKLYRRNSGLQCNSKLRELHDSLLLTQLNTNKSKSVIAIYNKLYKEYHGGFNYEKIKGI